MKGNNSYSFDGFALIKVTTPEETYFKVFGSRSGGYLDGDSWRLNSGVSSGVSAVQKDENYYYFRGNSGSLYKVPKWGGRISSYCYAVLQQMLDACPETSLVKNEDIEKELIEHGIEVEVV